jgi:hypothetical protein
MHCVCAAFACFVYRNPEQSRHSSMATPNPIPIVLPVHGTQSEWSPLGTFPSGQNLHFPTSVPGPAAPTAHGLHPRTLVGLSGGKINCPGLHGLSVGALVGQIVGPFVGAVVGVGVGPLGKFVGPFVGPLGPLVCMSVGAEVVVG